VLNKARGAVKALVALLAHALAALAGTMLPALIGAGNVLASLASPASAAVAHAINTVTIHAAITWALARVTRNTTPVLKALGLAALENETVYHNALRTGLAAIALIALTHTRSLGTAQAVTRALVGAGRLGAVKPRPALSAHARTVGAHTVLLVAKAVILAQLEGAVLGCPAISARAHAIGAVADTMTSAVVGTDLVVARSVLVPLVAGAHTSIRALAVV
jgi:hypothetical protein